MSRKNHQAISGSYTFCSISAAWAIEGTGFDFNQMDKKQPTQKKDQITRGIDGYREEDGMTPFDCFFRAVIRSQARRFHRNAGGSWGKGKKGL